METELILSIGGFPPLSARGCVQELLPLQQGNLRRTINGDLVYLGRNELKYRSIIQCNDKTVIATDGMHPGVEVGVGCIQRLWQKIEEDPENKPILLQKLPVSGSIYAMDENQNTIDFIQTDKQTISLENRNKTYYLSYRPWLRMRMVTYTLHINEWGIKSGWQLELEEI